MNFDKHLYQRIGVLLTITAAFGCAEMLRFEAPFAPPSPDRTVRLDAVQDAWVDSEHPTTVMESIYPNHLFLFHLDYVDSEGDAARRDRHAYINFPIVAEEVSAYDNSIGPAVLEKAEIIVTAYRYDTYQGSVALDTIYSSRTNEWWDKRVTWSCARIGYEGSCPTNMYPFPDYNWFPNAANPVIPDSATVVAFSPKVNQWTPQTATFDRTEELQAGFPYGQNGWRLRLPKADEAEPQPPLVHLFYSENSGHLGPKLILKIRVAEREVCDGFDNDNNGLIDDMDQDGDGQTVCEGDCDDTNEDVYSGRLESCYDGVDNNCDGLIDDDGQGDGDGDGWAAMCDCNDADPAINRGASESCDGVDNDCDHRVDSFRACNNGQCIRRCDVPSDQTCDRSGPLDSEGIPVYGDNDEDCCTSGDEMIYGWCISWPT